MRIFFANLFNKTKGHLLIIAISIILTAIFTWPFVTKLSTFYIDSGDYAFTGSLLWYNQDAIKTGKIFNQEKYLNGYQYYPQPSTIAYTDHIFIPSLFFSFIYYITNQFILSVNLLFFLSFVLSFITSYYFINYFVKNKLISIIGATVYTFNPIIFSHFPAHLNLLNHYFLPLIFLSLYIFLSKPSFKNALFFGLSFTLNGLTAVYFQLLSILILPVFAMPFLISHLIKKDLLYFLNLLKSSLIILIFLPILLYFNLPYLQFSKNEIAVRRLEETFFFSGRLINWFFTNPDSLIYGSFVKNFEKIRSPGLDSINGKFNYAEHTLFLNILPMILFLVGFIYLCKKTKNKNITDPLKLTIIAFALVLLSTLTLSFGPYFFGWNGGGPYWKLPYYYLYQLFPIFQGMRVPNRLQLIFYIPFVLFASYGLLSLFNKINNRFLIRILFISIIIILFVENYTLKSYQETSTAFKDVDKKMIEFKFLNNKKVLHYPIRIPELKETNIYTLNWNILTGANSLNGYSGYAPSEQLSFLISIKQKIDEEALKKLYILNANYVVFHKDLLSKEEFKEYTALAKLYELGKIYNKDNIEIVDLKKYDFKFNKCDFNKDISKELKYGTLEKTNQNFLVLILKNNSSCYLPSIYMEKYRNETFNMADLYGNPITKNVYFKLPVIIEPYQEVMLSEYNNEIRVE